MNNLKFCRTIVFALAMLLSAQVSSLLHAAEHDLAEHEHEGVACEFLQYLSASSGAIASDASAVFPSISSSEQIHWAVNESLSTLFFSYKCARAPPSQN